MPAEARRKVLGALRKAEGNVYRAARILKISHDQTNRYVVRFNLREKLEAIREEKGWYQLQARGGKKRTRWLKAKAKAVSTRVETPVSN